MMVSLWAGAKQGTPLASMWYYPQAGLRAGPGAVAGTLFRGNLDIYFNNLALWR